MYQGMKKEEVCDFWPSLDFACETLCKQFDKDFTHVYLAMLHFSGDNKNKNWLKESVRSDKENLKIILKEWKENELGKNPNPIAKEIMEDFQKCIKDFEEDFIDELISSFFNPGRDEELISLLCYFGLDYGYVYTTIYHVNKNIEFLMEIKENYYT